jgi:putative oxidoreductase
VGSVQLTTLVELRRPRLQGAASWLPTIVAVVAGAVFLSTAAGHLGNHDAEVADFRRYQVPFPSIAVWAVGAVELVGGAALVVGLFVRPVAAVLAADMIGVVATAGRVEGGLFNLGVAPLLLVAMVFLLWSGPGALTIDRAVTATT